MCCRAVVLSRPRQRGGVPAAERAAAPAIADQFVEARRVLNIALHGGVTNWAWDRSRTPYGRAVPGVHVGAGIHLWAAAHGQADASPGDRPQPEHKTGYGRGRSR
jgi:hypothetical protein